MAIRELPRADWNDYFDDFSATKSKEGRIEHAELLSLSPESGAQEHTSWLPLQGIVFDFKGDLLEVQLQGLDRLIGHPKRIFVDEENGRLTRFEVDRGGGETEIVEIRQP